jgi:hypothetical protein
MSKKRKAGKKKRRAFVNGLLIGLAIMMLLVIGLLVASNRHVTISIPNFKIIVRVFVRLLKILADQRGF